MNHSIRPQLVLPVAIVLTVVTVVLVLVFSSPGWDEPEKATAEPTILPSEQHERSARLEAWTRPATTDPKAMAIGYARAIWTYDTAKHNFDDWQDAVSVFADPVGEGPRIARSLLPLLPEWQQLELHHARASVDYITAEITPEMKQLQQSAAAPEGWTGFVVHGKQTVVLDTETIVADRQAAVGVVCTSICKFWSATAQIKP
ncbi:hypothetical protein [Kribbella sp. CA-293567]|uniref:hypothetical protein n=1 Tax=Kribbella sp. CA-293567 TaxID=3002436 RepID=UPI0022DD6DF0|nr:hypothetical protein [Kribbella sp. CA-293567]WBQ04407.1 hypothetical protein OX958_31145 [Kribbella sp. CA-293567]